MPEAFMAAEIGEYSYDKLLDLTVRYNRRIQNDKLARLPFLDNATGIAQRPCFLYRHNNERCHGFMTQIYQYPPHKWKKAKKTVAATQGGVCSAEIWNGTHKISTTNSQDASSRDLEDEDSRSTWPAGPDYDVDSDASDLMDETYGSRRKRRKPRSSRANRSLASTSRRRLGTGQQHYSSYSCLDEESNDRIGTATPMFVCEVCGVRYRSRTGLSYHFNSQHPNASRTGSGRVVVGGVSDSLSNHHHHHQQTNGGLHSPAVHGVHQSGCDQTTGILSTFPETDGKLRSRQSSTIIVDSVRTGDAHANWAADSAASEDSTCDFCLGDVRENKKTGLPEEMLRCSDCSRCAHFSCLQFTSNMVASIRTYRWQCIECKTCWLCGTSENDEQMLFCDDCDRGYHMYCLNPPLSEPPEGSWSCKLCVDHFRDSAASYKPSFVVVPSEAGGIVANSMPGKPSVHKERSKDTNALTSNRPNPSATLPCMTSNTNSHFSSSSSSTNSGS